MFIEWMYQGIKQGGINWSQGGMQFPIEIRLCAFCQLDYVISWVPIYKLINVMGASFNVYSNPSPEKPVLEVLW